MKTIDLSMAGGVATVTLNRPDVRNAFNGEMIEELKSVFGGFGEDVHAVVLTGAGTAFCAGADLDWMAKKGAEGGPGNTEAAVEMADLFRIIDEAPVAVIARVNGPARGGALGLVAACDIVVAAESVGFAFSEVRLGLVPAVISPFVIRKIGLSQARRYFVSGELFDAQRACEMGLVHEVATDDALDATVVVLIAQLAKNGPRAMAEAKALVREVSTRPRGQLALYTAETIARLRASAEGMEGIGAFVAKRPPQWVSHRNAGGES